MLSVITVDWSFVGMILIVLGGIGTAILAVAKWPAFKAASSGVLSVPQIAAPINAPVAEGDPAASRGADVPAPPGAVDWVLDICKAMSMAEPGTILEALKIGESRDQARTRRIAELEDLITKDGAE